MTAGLRTYMKAISFYSIYRAEVKLMDSVVFVAIKNGEHQSKGFAYFSEGVAHVAPSEGKHVSQIYNTVIRFFGLEASCSS